MAIAIITLSFVGQYKGELNNLLFGDILAIQTLDLVFSFAKQMTVLVNGAVLCSGEPRDIAKDDRVKQVYLGHRAVHGVPNE